MKKNRLISLIIRIFKSICTIKKKLLWTYSFLIVSQELLILLTLFIPKMIIEALLQGKTKLAFYAVGLLIIGSIFLTLSNKLLRQYINNFLNEIRLYYSIQLNKTFMEMDFERVETAEIREKKNLAFEGLENYIQIILIAAKNNNECPKSIVDLSKIDCVILRNVSAIKAPARIPVTVIIITNIATFSQFSLN